jgi:serine/threonine protein kinase
LENIVLDTDGNIKLIDFDHAIPFPVRKGELPSLAGTLWYIAPELLTDHTETSYDKPINVWSIGCLLYEMLTGRVPFMAERKEDLMEAIKTKMPRLTKKMSAEVCDLFNGLFDKDPATRMTFEEMKNHTWFKGVDWLSSLEKKEVPPVVPTISSGADVTNFDPVRTRDMC